MICVPFLSMLFVAEASTILCTCLIAMDRLIYISDPFIYQDRVNRTKIRIALGVVWIMSFLYGSWGLFHNNFIPHQDCRIHLVLPIEMRVYGGASLYIACMLITAIAYYKITKIAVEHKKRIDKSRSRFCKGRRKQFIGGVCRIRETLKYFKSIRLFLLMFCFLFVCYTPYMVGEIVMTATGNVNLTVQRTFALLITFHSGTNVIIYSLFNRDFRFALRNSVLRANSILPTRMSIFPGLPVRKQVRELSSMASVSLSDTAIGNLLRPGSSSTSPHNKSQADRRTRSETSLTTRPPVHDPIPAVGRVTRSSSDAIVPTTQGACGQSVRFSVVTQDSPSE
ncbi:hypothetical protein BaRGS_00031733 [Batillaria attramentaria]|uniref:G-protein coupled receptors family 1 profile domain-containing protein n=1 Tax=Batillaria attramentaria TaxID=370345 RepID=A0ABD0JPQ4_9CAEN